MVSWSRALIAIGLSLAGCLATSVQSASADTTGPFWTCRASVGYLGNGPGRIEPFVANGSDASGLCANDDAGHTNPPPLTSSQGSIEFQSVYAGTRIDPTVSSSDLQKVGALGQVQHVRIQNADKSFVLTADVTQAGMSGSCNGGMPGFADSGAVTGVVINGQSVPTDQAYEQTGNAINGSPFGQVTKVYFNELVASGSSTSVDQSVTRRAIHVQIFDGNGNDVFDAVVGEASAGRHGPVCQQGPRCPDGATYDPTRGVCVIRETVNSSGPCPPDTSKEGNVCVRTVVVGTPAGQSRGGTVKPLGEVLGVRSTSPCKNKRFGSQIGIVGTPRADHITGSNKSDRIFVYAGRDRVSGGRGNDCVEGDAGSDQLDGSTGSDWLLGGLGNDHLAGGPGGDWLFGGSGNDNIDGGTGDDHIYGGPGRDTLEGGRGNNVIYGGSGRDYIRGGRGRDVIKAGSGNDEINVAAAGPPAHVDCGPGVDTIRINHDELHTIRHCERVFVTTRLSRYNTYNKKTDKKKRP